MNALERQLLPQRGLSEYLGLAPLPHRKPNLYQRAQAQYPRLPDVLYKENFGGDSGYLEYWPPTEPGTPDRPRPSDFPMGSVGVEVYDRETRPIDVAGDIVSHGMINDDPVISQTYRDFESSLDDRQKERLREQYEYSQKNFGENRPFDDWYEMTGLPGYFRGYAFQQWENPERMYRPDQIEIFDKMMQYLKGKNKEDL